MPQPASAGHQLVDPRGEQLMAFRIAERAHSASQTPAVSEVMVHRGLFLLVRVPPVPFPASGLSSGAFLLEAFPVPHRQHPTAGIAELADHVRGAALVSDVQIHGPVTLLLAVLRHKGVLLPGQEVQENVTTSLGAGNVLLDSWHNQTIETKKSNKATPYPSAHLYLTECTIFRHRRTSGSSPITNRRQAAHIP
ncbi:Uncharacterised protein [Bifidobacterium longum subsp. infantis]|uniref:Uncharacterized protein n=1 Tax=Bifidobacterium longum subsp. infantis TaxID=1682 RepID=A0ABM9R414_BIFLI|nr:hypothetical protein BLIC_a01042 [Bifidobacterium longum subsp. infantis]CEE99662.1 hypothetical protein BLIC_b01045 [Bifidobacterium longum subsp. infantis]CEF00552.1 hypothetical protein BLIC_c01049 [Bifidobacterium longum subsp. infantis]CEF04862.1 hypothetical protein BLIC_e01045 [Bifidobacterium longum subsp. infantis]CEF07495.1 hypothetical protein BLIC_g01045 [Bifidobacterium longum subsp. infantis]